ncbi:hypothetical protein D3C81_169900 [compost metagenome]
MSRYAEKRSFSYCKETCPDVDSVFSDFLEEVKRVGTNKLRDALTEASSDLIDAEAEVEDLKRQLSAKDDEISDLLQQIRELEKESV